MKLNTVKNTELLVLFIQLVNISNMAPSYVMTFVHVLFMKRLQQGMYIYMYNYKGIILIFVAVGENFTDVICVSH